MYYSCRNDNGVQHVPLHFFFFFFVVKFELSFLRGKIKNKFSMLYIKHWKWDWIWNKKLMPTTSLQTRRCKSCEMCKTCHAYHQRTQNTEDLNILVENVWKQPTPALCSVSVAHEEPGFSCFWHSSFLTALCREAGNSWDS